MLLQLLREDFIGQDVNDIGDDSLVYDIVMEELTRLEENWREIVFDEISLNKFCEEIYHALEISIDEVSIDELQSGTERAISDFRREMIDSYISESDRRIAKRICRVLPFIKTTLERTYENFMKDGDKMSM